jgi:hypothetical protein
MDIHKFIWNKNLVVPLMKLSKFTLYQIVKSNVLHNEYSNTIRDGNELNKWNAIYSIVERHYTNKWKNIRFDNNMVIDYIN